jgi:DNA-3-methyladenine glycosylase II
LGIGPWTAQIYVMFCMGRADMFPPGDLALQEAAKVLFDLPRRPTPTALAGLAQDWSPWRSVAARALFAYYRMIKQREGLG